MIRVASSRAEKLRNCSRDVTKLSRVISAGFVNARTAQLGMLGQILSTESALIRSEDTLILVFRPHCAPTSSDISYGSPEYFIE